MTREKSAVMHGFLLKFNRNVYREKLIVFRFKDYMKPKKKLMRLSTYAETVLR